MSSPPEAHETWSAAPPEERKPATPTKKHLGWLYAVCAVLVAAASFTIAVIDSMV